MIASDRFRRPAASTGIAIAATILVGMSGPSAGPFGPGSARAQAGSELIWVPVPGGWTAEQSRQTGRVEVHAIYPPGQSSADWMEQLTIQKYPTGDPIDYLEQQKTVFERHCASLRATPVAPSLDAGLPTAVRTLSCDRIAGQRFGEHVMFKAIRGRSGFYVLSKSWRIEDGQRPALLGIDQWVKVLKASRPCGGGSAACVPGGLVR